MLNTVGQKRANGSVAQGCEPTARMSFREERGTARGSPRSFTSQKRSFEDDK